MNISLSSQKSLSDLSGLEHNYEDQPMSVKTIDKNSVARNCQDWGYFIDLDATGIWGNYTDKPIRQVVRSHGGSMYIIKEEEEEYDMIHNESTHKPGILQRIVLNVLRGNANYSPKWVIWKKKIPFTGSCNRKISLSMGSIGLLCMGLVMWFRLCALHNDEKYL